MKEKQTMNKSRSKTFGIVINPKIEEIELGSETRIPDSQVAKSVCPKKPILKALQTALEAFINIDVQFDFNEMKKYCNKEFEFLSEEYSGKIFKHSALWP